MKNIKHFFIILSACAALIILFELYSLFRDGQPAKSRLPDETAEMRSMQLVLSGGKGLDLLNFSSADIETALESLQKKDLISNVVIEKSTVCTGEAFEVHIVMDNREQSDSDLVCRLGDKFGDTAVFNYSEPGDQQIRVYVRDRKGNIDSRIIPIRVIDCPEKAALFIDAHKNSRMANEIEYAVIEKKNISCPCVFEWDFGDGMTQKSMEETISHDYGGRAQEEFSTTFIASIKATGKNGVQVATRTSVTLINTLFVSKSVGFAVVPIIYDTNPDLVDDRYMTRIKIENIYNVPILFETATITIKNSSTGETKEQETFSAGSIIKKTELKGGEIVEDIVAVPSRLVPDSGHVIQIELAGAFPDKMPAKGIIFLFKQ